MFAKKILFTVIFSFAQLIFAQSDLDAQFLLSPRDNKNLDYSEKMSWAKLTCTSKLATFAWRGCKAQNFDNKTPAIVTSDVYFEPRSVIFGSFTAPNEREALISFERLETECCITIDVLFRYSYGKFHAIEVYKSTGSIGCLRFRLASRRDALGCATQSAQGYFGNPETFSNLYSQTLFQGTPKEINLFSFVNYKPNCEDQEEQLGAVQTPFQSLDIRNWGRSDEDKDGLVDLIVKIGERNWKSTSIKAACREDPPITLYKLVFLATDRGLAPTAQTRSLVIKFLNKFKRRS